MASDWKQTRESRRYPADGTERVKAVHSKRSISICAEFISLLMNVLFLTPFISSCPNQVYDCRPRLEALWVIDRMLELNSGWNISQPSGVVSNWHIFLLKQQGETMCWRGDHHTAEWSSCRAVYLWGGGEKRQSECTHTGPWGATLRNSTQSKWDSLC